MTERITIARVDQENPRIKRNPMEETLGAIYRVTIRASGRTSDEIGLEIINKGDIGFVARRKGSEVVLLAATNGKQTVAADERFIPRSLHDEVDSEIFCFDRAQQEGHDIGWLKEELRQSGLSLGGPSCRKLDYSFYRYSLEDLI